MARREPSHRLVSLVLPVVLATACTHTVVPPANPDEPVAAFLLDHGRHASLVLERDDGITRYSYGHWSYYAENLTGPLRASGTLFGANPAGLGRKQLPGPANLAAVQRQVLVPIEAMWRIEVSATRSADLSNRLETVFREQSATRLFNPLYDLEFVRHPEPYSVGHNSNHLTGEWLRALGCEVEMYGPFSNWRVENAAESSRGDLSDGLYQTVRSGLPPSAPASPFRTCPRMNAAATHFASKLAPTCRETRSTTGRNAVSQRVGPASERSGRMQSRMRAP